MYRFDGQAVGGEEDVEDVEEDFYGLNASSNAANGDMPAFAGASERPPTNGMPSVNSSSGRVVLDKNIKTPGNPSASNAEQRKAENQKKAADLRAKLIAQRQSTPVKAVSKPNTPSKAASETQQEPKAGSGKDETQIEHSEPSSDTFGLESLLAEGKAAAEAKLQQNPPSASKPNGESPRVVPGATDSGRNKQSISTTSDKPAKETEQQPLPTALTDAYYEDLPVWLEVTGYHDVAYRNSKLRTYKERRALEKEAARIAERLEKLKQTERAEMASLRSAIAHPTAGVQMAPPALPDIMPTGGIIPKLPINNPMTPATTANGIKRARSPEPVISEKSFRRREGPTNFRIRGSKNSPEMRPTPAHRAHSPSFPGLERRISYPDARRRSLDEINRSAPKKETRDPSLERRQAYYKRESASGAPLPFHNRDDRFDRAEYGYNDAARGHEDRLRADRTATDRFPAGLSHRDYQPQSKGSSGLDLKKGGVRYFMIKSWNHENVITAMRDGLWATQEKNEQILTEAFKTSRHVVLLFSVNKSMQFQGYALMTSPPDPNLPKPPFCAKLNWGTSPAFTLRWLATAPVHFKFVGHLKNDFNQDDYGHSTAVLIGKDGQEISPDAGMGVVSILDEAEDGAIRKHTDSIPPSNGPPIAAW